MYIAMRHVSLLFAAWKIF